MRLTPAIVTNTTKDGARIRSRVLVNMDKFVDAVPASGDRISLWFEGSFSMTMEKEDFMKLLCDTGLFSQRDASELVPSDNIYANDFQTPGGAWGNHIS